MRITSVQELSLFWFRCIHFYVSRKLTNRVVFRFYIFSFSFLSTFDSINSWLFLFFSLLALFGKQKWMFLSPKSNTNFRNAILKLVYNRARVLSTTPNVTIQDYTRGILDLEHVGNRNRMRTDSRSAIFFFVYHCVGCSCERLPRLYDYLRANGRRSSETFASTMLTIIATKNDTSVWNGTSRNERHDVKVYSNRNWLCPVFVNGRVVHSFRRSMFDRTYIILLLVYRHKRNV